MAGTVTALAAALSSQASGTPAAATGAPVIVQNVRVPVPGQHAVRAYLVRPAGTLRAHSEAGILFLHWLGQIHSDRTEFLAEATQLAPRVRSRCCRRGSSPGRSGPRATVTM